jgi:hypothetical protein
MIPLFAVIRWNTGGRWFAVWLPLFLAWLMLLPLVVLLLPVFVIACLVACMNPGKLLITGWRMAAGLTGVNIEVQHGRTQVVVRMV